MTIVYVLLGAVILQLFLLYRMITRMIKYQNFKSNVILRLALKDDMEELTKREQFDLDNVGEGFMESAAPSKRAEIVEKISRAIDEEIDNEYIWNWKELITAIRAEEFFRTELSEPFHRAFNPHEIIKRHNERNKEYIKKDKK